MDVSVRFNLFVIQVPKAPFGFAWYQGDIQTDKQGRGRGQFVGRFSVEVRSSERRAQRDSNSYFTSSLQRRIAERPCAQVT